MKSKFSLLLVLILTTQALFSQEEPLPDVYLLTCGPGTETYSVYGHSAIRIVKPGDTNGVAYNWGVFDFNTRNFAWKFAKGRLDYMLDTTSYRRFLTEYYSEGRWVVSQKVNLTPDETRKLLDLIADNLKPENIKYRYDFFYDNCSTRIRDLLEKAVGDKLTYPPDDRKAKKQSFRELSGMYEAGKPWLKLGIDLVLGSPSDKKASFRDRMFLPIEMMNGLSAITVLRDGKMVPLLQNPQTVLDFEQPPLRRNLFVSPMFILAVLLIVIIIVTGMFRGKTVNKAIDISLFALFSILALLMIFFNFFADHVETKRNLNIVWLNPFIFICFAAVLLDRNWQTWFRIVFYLGVLFLLLIAVLPQEMNNASVPLIITLLLRSSIRSGFSWNPLNLPYLTEL